MLIKIRTVRAWLLAALCLPAVGMADSNERLVTIGPGVTEIVYALHQGDRIVGTDTSSRIPVAANQLPKVGYYRGLSSEGLLSLNLNHLIGTENMGPPIVLEQLKKAGVELTILSGDTGIEGLEQRIHQLAEALGEQEAGRALWEKTQKSLEAAKAFSKHQKPLKVMFMMAHTGTAMVAGNNTTAGALIELAGGVNPVKDKFSGYKPVSAESLLLMAPDVILVSSATLNKEGSAESVLKLLPGIQATPAGRNSKVLTIDGSIIMAGLSPRVGEEALRLAKQMYGAETSKEIVKN